MVAERCFRCSILKVWFACSLLALLLGFRASAQTTPPTELSADSG